MAAMIAGSGPATPVLVAARQSRPYSPHDCPRATGDRPANHDTHPHPGSQKDRTRAQRRNSSPLGARPNPHSARGTPLPHFTRFRALALFGRRPLQRVDSPVMPATENLHTSRHRPNFTCDKLHCRFGNRLSRLYGGRPASRQAFARGSASTAGSARPAQNPPALKEGCNDNTSTASAFASSKLPSLTKGATSKL